MLDLVDLVERPLDSYYGVAPDEQLDQLRRAAEPLRGARVLHVNATPYGGGVSELLRSVVPIMSGLGITTHWRIISGNHEFYEVTKAIHNGLQGAEHALTDKQKATYLASQRTNASAFTEEYDFIVMHDPQTAGILPFRGKGERRWIWRCHIDTAAPNPHVWDFVRPFLSEYDAAVFTMEEFVPPDLPIAHVEIIPPAIDPLSPKNLPLPPPTARQILEWIGVRLDRPLVTQVSRFDPWKDPMGVIRAYRLAREEISELQLALVGSLALDDPEAWGIYREIEDEAKNDPAINVFTNLVGVGNIEVNAFQSLSNVIMQKSLREGFGLVVSESMWKGTPVVAGRAGGIPLQMADGAGGVLVDSIEECAREIVALVRDPARAKALGASGRQRVREHFLIPRLVCNELSLLQEVASARPMQRVSRRDRDPVCGMAIERGHAITQMLDGVTYVFCSERCRATFLDRRGMHETLPERTDERVAMH